MSSEKRRLTGEFESLEIDCSDLTFGKGRNGAKELWKSAVGVRFFVGRTENEMLGGGDGGEEWSSRGITLKSCGDFESSAERKRV